MEYSYLADDGKTLVMCADYTEFPTGKGWLDPKKIVKQEDYKGYFISTVHLPLNHRLDPFDTEDKWFETIEQHEEAKKWVDSQDAPP